MRRSSDKEWALRNALARPLQGGYFSSNSMSECLFFSSPCIQLTKSFLVSVSVIPRDLSVLPTAV